jgi:predicted nucleic acid-binding protein
MADRDGPAVVDTMVFSWALMGAATEIGRAYAPQLVGRTVILAAQTVAELRYGAIHSNWGDKRRADLEERIATSRVVRVDDALSTRYAELKDRCVRQGHALGQKQHDGDRWIAATALRYEIPLISHDGVFIGAPELELITELEISR